MKIYKGLNDRSLKAGRRCLAIGIFDGVHRGHRAIIQKTLDEARRMRVPSMVVTFDPHPNKILRPSERHPVLMSLPHRLRLFEAMGVKETLVIRFNKTFSKVSHVTFLEKYLVGRLGMKALSVGHDFCFGYRARGTIRFLRRESKRLGYRFRQVRPLKYAGQVISSTRVRQLIRAGFLHKAAAMLGRPVSVYGTVVRGRGRGRSVGFPTANLNPHHEKLPPVGVYAARGFLGNTPLRGLIHIGERPTFKDREKSLEVHFFNFHRNIYGRELELIFIKRLRGIRRFKDRKALAEAIRRDSRAARKVL